MRRVQDVPEVGEFIDQDRVLGRHDRCGDLMPGRKATRCQLEYGHGALHADVSLSGLVLATWPGCDCGGCEAELGCDYADL